jgi:hypothetical protein
VSYLLCEPSFAAEDLHKQLSKVQALEVLKKSQKNVSAVIFYALHSSKPLIVVYNCETWDVILCSLADIFRRFGRPFLKLHDVTFQNIGFLIVRPESPNLTFWINLEFTLFFSSSSLPLWSTGLISRFHWSFLQTARLFRRVISSSQCLYLNTGQHKYRINAYTHQTSMPCVRFEPTIPLSERAITVHASDLLATVTGLIYL